MKNEIKKIRNKDVWYITHSPTDSTASQKGIIHFGFIEIGQNLITAHTTLEEYETEEEMSKALDILKEEEGWYESYKLKLPAGGEE
jgi:hypothetical protein